MTDRNSGKKKGFSVMAEAKKLGATILHFNGDWLFKTKKEAQSKADLVELQPNT